MGLIRFDQFQHDRLYGPDGFYTTGGAAGAAGDFLTAPELGDEFARALAVELDRRWFALGRPDPFVVVEGGAGVGTLASGVLRHAGDCRAALRWVMVEISAAQREAAVRRLADDLELGSTDELPAVAIADLRVERFHTEVHVVVANELLDNLPVRIVRRSDTGVEELYVELGPQRAVEHWQPADDGAAARAAAFGTGVPEGLEFPLADQMLLWTHRARQLVTDGGAVMLFDYGASTAELACRPDRGWLRTYDRHRRAGSPLDLGRPVDITSDVPFDQLGGQPTVDRMREWITSRRPAAAAATDPATRALLDPAGVGGFSVLTW